jgi:hypothetical protein
MQSHDHTLFFWKEWGLHQEKPRVHSLRNGAASSDQSTHCATTPEKKF